LFSTRVPLTQTSQPSSEKMARPQLARVQQHGRGDGGQCRQAEGRFGEAERGSDDGHGATSMRRYRDKMKTAHPQAARRRAVKGWAATWAHSGRIR
jgi:hypothetical protein